MESELTQVAELGWTPDLKVAETEGACGLVFGVSGPALVGLPLHEVLGIPVARAVELDLRVRKAGDGAPLVEFISSARQRDGRALRLVLGVRRGLARAGVIDMTAALEGAPPIQITRLSSSLAHEIRNPLSSVKMAVQTLARNTTLGDRDKRRLAIANREIRTMERMLWMLSEYGRDSDPLLEGTTLRAVIQETAASIEPELLDRKVTLDIQEEPGLPRIRVDPTRLRPVLGQLLLNVASALPVDSRLPVLLQPWPERDGCCLILEDASAALPPEEHASVFEPFGSRLARGAGLSLAALYRVMVALGGAVRAEGGLQPPTLFTVCFPP